MKIEEALEYFKERIEYCNRYERKDLSNKYALAIAACEKQIAKKPLKITMEYDGDYGRCPSCNEILADYSDTRVCKSCGQKIDWGKDE